VRACAWLGLAALGATGCLPALDDGLDSSAAAIFGGVQTTDHAEVGWLAFDEDFVCTAVLITPRRALTAAHCVYAYANDPSLLSVAFATGTARPPLSAAVGVEALFLAPDYTTILSHDLAVLELSADAPAAPIPFRETALTDADLDADLILVGFGRDAACDPEDERPRRLAEVTLDELDPVSIRWFSDDAGLCDGDSGGAVFIDDAGALELIGVATEGDVDCAARGAGVRTDVFAAFLNAPGSDDDDAGDDDFGDDDDFNPTVDGCAGCGGGGAVALLPLMVVRRRSRS
jgi:hypothetical protein